jgi:glycosyltransferase involved in cell wall biosynthesis
MKLKINRTVTVITPTIGKPELLDAVKSVYNQTVKCKHLVVVDGPDYWADINQHELNDYDVQLALTPDNTGANGFNGQRIYAAFPHLINSDYIAFLDEDNWYEPNHIESLIETIEQNGFDFAYSLRQIYSKDRCFRANDNCESLGKWPIFMSHKAPQGPQYLIDTSSYLFKRPFIQKTCHLWHSGPWGEDRRYLYYVKDEAKFDTNGKHTLCYRLGGNPNSVTEDFFTQGNKIQSEYYGGDYPWVK